MPERSSDFPRLRELPWVLDHVPVSESTLAREIRHGHLPVVRIGGRTLVDEHDLRAYLMARKQRGPDHSPLPLNDGTRPHVREG